MENINYWDITSGSLGVHQRKDVSYLSGFISKSRKKPARNRLQAHLLLLSVLLFGLIFDPENEGGTLHETSLNLCRTTGCCIPEDSTHLSYLYENLKYKRVDDIRGMLVVILSRILCPLPRNVKHEICRAVIRAKLLVCIGAKLSDSSPKE
jgi:hypothetical protein